MKNLLNMKKNLVGVITAIILTTTVLAGCGTEKKEETGGTKTTAPVATNAPKAKKVKDGIKPFTVSLRHINVRDTQKKTLAMLQDVVDKTLKDVPGLKIEMDGVEDTVNRDTKLKAEMAAGNQPNIFNLFGGDDTINYAKAGRLLPLNDILAKLNLSDQFFDLREFTVDGKIYGLPEAGYVEGFYYNKKLFANAGITAPPTTWDGFLADCAALKAKGITPIAMGGGAGDAWVINMLFNSLFVGLGGPELQEGFAKGTGQWTDPKIVDAFAKLKDLKDKGFIDTNVLGLKYAEGQAKFYTAQAAMLFDGSWATSAIVDPTKSTMAADAGFFRFPNISGAGDGLINGGWSNGYGFSSVQTPDQLAAIEAFINNFYNPAMQTRQLIDDNRIPSMKGVSDITGAQPLVAEIGKQQASATKAYPAFDALVQAKVKAVVESTVQELLGGKLTPDKAAETIQKVQDLANKAQK
ncbi:extracellular solute-binding protein [Paenibacillus psychroresistens]|nr:extracellular solute-binding protein [Paenibacillus psychroresistens]